MKKNIFHGFTLVELIIVVTILSVLSTIAFISFQSYSKNARDSNRLETMSIVQKGISLNQVTTSKTLLPDDYTQVLASGSLLGYEGIVGEGVSRGIKLSSIPLDPIRGENYIYYTNKDRNKVQVMGFMEGESLAYLGIDKANAAGSGTKIPKVSGDRLGILLDGNNNRVTGTGVDILLTNSGTSYTTYFSNSDNLTSSGKDLYSNLYNRRSDLIKDTSLASLDDSLVGYWDMETTTLSGGVKVLKDLSKNGNNGTCYDNSTISNCIKPSLFSDKKTIIIPHNSNKNTLGDWTRIILLKPSTINNGDGANHDIWSERNTSNKLLIRISPDGKYYIFYYKADSSFPWIIGDYNFGKSYSIVIMKKGNNIYFYINGILVTQNNNIDNFVNDNNQIFLGSTTTFGFQNYYGTIDGLRIYNKSLSDSEIKNLSSSIK